jgi:hypothetical protein
MKNVKKKKLKTVFMFYNGHVGSTKNIKRNEEEEEE